MSGLEIRAERDRIIESLIARARDGEPSFLTITGDAGLGKTSHLEEIVSRAAEFSVLRAGGVDGDYRPPFDVLQQLGVVETTTRQGRALAPAVAAQSLRRVVDTHAARGPVLLVVDDAQWADIESLASLALFAQRLESDRILLVVATRPFGAHEHPSWSHIRAPHVTRESLVLDGMNADEALTVVAHASNAERLSLDVGLCERLRKHTNSNPLYLKSIVQQYGLDELANMATLPAPEVAAREMRRRLEHLEPKAGRFLRALAIIGPGWTTTALVADVADITDDASVSLDLLVDEGLIHERHERNFSEVRLVHALTRAAVLQEMPGVVRRELHARASRTVQSLMDRLAHEVAATSGPDATLADRLEASAVEAHTRAEYQRAAQLLRWSSAVSASVEQRETRSLESLIESCLARDVSTVRAELGETSWASETAQRALTTALLLVTERRIVEARRLLLSLPEHLIESAPQTTASRLLILMAWTLLVSAHPTLEVRQLCDRVEQLGPIDPAFLSLHVRVAGQVAGRELDYAQLQQALDAVPLEVRTTPIADTGRLGWRGSMYAMCGFAREGRRDLAEVVARIRGGSTDVVDGVDHGLYGFALWQDGEFDRANIELQTAEQSALVEVHPLVQALLPLVPSVRGDFESADRLLARAETTLRDLPWREALGVLSQAQIVRLHAAGDAARQRDYLARYRSVFGADADKSTRGDGAIWQLHMAMARIWADESDAVDDYLTAIEQDLIVPDWIAWARPWIEALAAERQGDTETAHRLLGNAVAVLNDELPLYRAHVHIDFARLAAASGHRGESSAAISEAERIYVRLGATPYAARLASEHSMPLQVDILAPLSEREREVAALVIGGLSYAQIAQDLYVTRSTVGFHLSNIYAKTGVRTRHELIQLARTSSSA